MNIRIWGAALLFLAASAVSAATDGVDAARTVGVKVRAVSAAWEAGDTALLESTLAEDFTHVDGKGHVQSRDVFISGAHRKLQRDKQLGDLQVSVYGDVAVAAGTEQFRSGGALRFIQVWTKSPDWQLKTFQVTRVQKADAK